MDTLGAVALVLVGLALLAVGGEALVRAATTFAELAGVTPAVIGLTVVAMGTSLPELAVSLLAAREGRPDLAVANVVGSNIFNVAAALGVTAMIVPLPVHGMAVRFEWPFMFVTSFVCLLLARDGVIDRLEGGFFVASLLLFVAYNVHVSRSEVGAVEAREIAAHVEDRDIDAPGRGKRPARVAIPIAVLIGGVVALVLGGRFLVNGAITLAQLERFALVQSVPGRGTSLRGEGDGSVLDGFAVARLAGLGGRDDLERGGGEVLGQSGVGRSGKAAAARDGRDRRRGGRRSVAGAILAGQTDRRAALITARPDATLVELRAALRTPRRADARCGARLIAWD